MIQKAMRKKQVQTYKKSFIGVLKMIKDKKDYFDFLNDLRESGLINMFESPSHLKSEFPELMQKEANKVFSEWALNFGKNKNS